jgi:hypothetical protein
MEVFIAKFHRFSILEGLKGGAMAGQIRRQRSGVWMADVRLQHQLTDIIR